MNAKDPTLLKFVRPRIRVRIGLVVPLAFFSVNLWAHDGRTMANSPDRPVLWTDWVFEPAITIPLLLTLVLYLAGLKNL